MRVELNKQVNIEKFEAIASLDVYTKNRNDYIKILNFIIKIEKIMILMIL